jgi:hypothetical protein
MPRGAFSSSASTSVTRDVPAYFFLHIAEWQGVGLAPARAKHLEQHDRRVRGSEVNADQRCTPLAFPCVVHVV